MLDGSLSLDSGLSMMRGQLDGLSVLLVNLERCLDELSDCIEDCGGDAERTLSKLVTLKANAERAWQQLNELDNLLVLDDLSADPL